MKFILWLLWSIQLGSDPFWCIRRVADCPILNYVRMIHHLKIRIRIGIFAIGSVKPNSSFLKYFRRVKKEYFLSGRRVRKLMLKRGNQFYEAALIIHQVEIVLLCSVCRGWQFWTTLNSSSALDVFSHLFFSLMKIPLGSGSLINL